jgi:hypothetical protein
MSLINEALKRANQVPFRETAPGGPAMRPVQAGRHPEGGVGLLLPIMLAVVTTLAVLLLWQGFRANYILQVRARSVPATDGPAPAASPVVPSPAPAEERTPASPTPAPVAATPAAPVPVIQTPVVAAATNAVVAEEPKPQPPSYKLQAIFYRTDNPAAVINGRQLFIGDHVGEAYVVSIEPDSVALVNASGQTNLLEMP